MWKQSKLDCAASEWSPHRKSVRCQFGKYNRKSISNETSHMGLSALHVYNTKQYVEQVDLAETAASKVHFLVVPFHMFNLKSVAFKQTKDVLPWFNNGQRFKHNSRNDETEQVCENNGHVINIPTVRKAEIQWWFQNQKWLFGHRSCNQACNESSLLSDEIQLTQNKNRTLFFDRFILKHVTSGSQKP